MVTDSSALVAVHLREPGWESMIEKLQDTRIAIVGAPTLVETVLVLSARLRVDALPALTMFLHHFRIEVVPFTAQHFDIAADAFVRYGKGRHPAALNFGDCISYAVASFSGLPLLYTGEGFARTDIEPA